MSQLKVNSIESLSGPTGTINIVGEIVVNGTPIAGSAGPAGADGATGATGPAGTGGISGSTVVYVSADSDPVTNGIALQNAYNEAKLLAQSTITSHTWNGEFWGNTYVSMEYGSFLQKSLAQLYSDGGSVPVACTANGAPAWYTWDGMSINMSSTIDMMTALPAGTYPIITNIITYTYSTLIIAPGYYQTDSTFVIDTERVNITSLSGEPDVFIYSPKPTTMMGGTPAWVSVTANNITVTGISTVLKFSSGMNEFNGNGQISLGDNLTYLTMKNCIGGDYSFGASGYVSGLTISGTFINCKVKGRYGFGSSSAILSGTFIDCVNTSYCGFGYNSCSLSGTFTNCKSTNENNNGGYGFGNYNGTLSGIFNNCSELGNAGFGVQDGILTGQFNNCSGNDYCFGGQNGNSGVFINCVAGVAGWSNPNVAGTFYHCIGGQSSWSTLNGGAVLIHCVIKQYSSSSFGTVSAMNGGRTRYCVDGYGMTNNQ